MTLNYAVYESENALVEDGSTTFTGTSTTFNTNLLSGKDYTLAFFAQVSEYADAYTFSAEGKSVTANYGVMTNMDAFNSGGYDCFYGTYAYPASGAAGSISVTLYRPVAQVNWGTNDLTGKIEETFKSVYSTLQTEAYTQFSLLDGEMSDKQKLTLGPVQAPTVDYPSVGNSTYTYVGMQYLLAKNTSEVYDLNLAISNNNGTETGETVDLVVTSAPLQANYRTNIYGSLLTDNVNLNITLAEWGGSILDPQDMGDEIDGSGLYLNKTTKTYFITSVSALQKMAEVSQDISLQNYKMVLTTDLDMKDQPYTTYIKNSLGTFDGQGHTISNLTISGTTNVGFFSQGLGTIQNVTFENANVSGNHYVAIVAGYGANAQFNNITIKGGSVTTTPMESGSTYKYGDKAGAITGYLSGEDGTAAVTNCSVSGVNVTGYKMIGSIVGYANNANNYPASVCNIQNNSATDCTVTANQKFDGTYESTDVPFDAGEICGYYATGTTQSNNTATNVSLTTIAPDGQTTASVASQSALQSAANNAGANITIQPGEYTLPTNRMTNVTIKGSSSAVINIGTSQPAGYNGVTFDGITFNGGNNYVGIQHSSDITYKNCILNGFINNYADGLTFENCTFNQSASDYCLNTYTANNVLFKGCNFNCQGKAVYIFNELNANASDYPASGYKITFTDCTFKASKPNDGDGPKDGKAAINVNGSAYNPQVTFIVDINDCTATGFSTDTNSGSSLWNYKTAAKTEITVDDTVVYNSLNN